MIREATEFDAPAITNIYNYYVEHSGATMEYEKVDSSFYVSKIKKTQDSGHFWLVAEEDGEIIGYAYSGTWNPREGYRFTCEVSIYISSKVITKGWGTKLYAALFNKLREAGMLVIIAVITLPNEPSIALHEKFGMERVAYFPKMGIKFDRWLDVGYWQVNYQLSN